MLMLIEAETLLVDFAQTCSWEKDTGIIYSSSIGQTDIPLCSLCWVVNASAGVS